MWWLTSGNMYEYIIQAAGLSPTVGVWSPYQRKCVLQRVCPLYGDNNPLQHALQYFLF